MVLLTMTAPILEALKELNRPSSADKVEVSTEQNGVHKEPSLTEPAIGKPISHAQIIDIWKKSRAQIDPECSLESLLLGATIYIPPPPPKPEPVGTQQYYVMQSQTD
jgi:TMEM199 family protein